MLTYRVHIKFKNWLLKQLLIIPNSQGSPSMRWNSHQGMSALEKASGHFYPSPHFFSFLAKSRRLNWTLQSTGPITHRQPAYNVPAWTWYWTWTSTTPASVCIGKSHLSFIHTSLDSSVNLQSQQVGTTHHMLPWGHNPAHLLSRSHPSLNKTQCQRQRTYSPLSAGTEQKLNWPQRAGMVLGAKLWRERGLRNQPPRVRLGGSLRYVLVLRCPILLGEELTSQSYSCGAAQLMPGKNTNISAHFRQSSNEQPQNSIATWLVGRWYIWQLTSQPSGETTS
jgi:hypothetical protein